MIFILLQFWSVSLVYWALRPAHTLPFNQTMFRWHVWWSCTSLSPSVVTTEPQLSSIIKGGFMAECWLKCTVGTFLLCPCDSFSSSSTILASCFVILPCLTLHSEQAGHPGRGSSLYSLLDWLIGKLKTPFLRSTNGAGLHSFLFPKATSSFCFTTCKKTSNELKSLAS